MSNLFDVQLAESALRIREVNLITLTQRIAAKWFKGKLRGLDFQCAIQDAASEAWFRWKRNPDAPDKALAFYACREVESKLSGRDRGETAVDWSGYAEAFPDNQTEPIALVDVQDWLNTLTVDQSTVAKLLGEGKSAMDVERETGIRNQRVAEIRAELEAKYAEFST